MPVCSSYAKNYASIIYKCLLPARYNQNACADPAWLNVSVHCVTSVTSVAYDFLSFIPHPAPLRSFVIPHPIITLIPHPAKPILQLQSRFQSLCSNWSVSLTSMTEACRICPSLIPISRVLSFTRRSQF